MASDAVKARISAFTLNAMRIVFALDFMQHGAQKLFGVWGFSHPVALASEFGVAGILEFFGGALLALGLFTRPVAFILAGEMAVTFFQFHFPSGVLPIVNHGELPVLFCWAYLFFAANGGGSFSVDGWLAARRERRRLAQT
ncbi:MAG: DoxX family protein [Gemmatimonadetes bacterium]|nr:DoxX family protein [Gemmatimonadota bacterium]